VRDFEINLRDDPQIQTAQLWPRLRLVLVGGGPQRAALQALASQLNVTEQVTFVEQIPHESVPDWLNRFDVFVMPSRLDSESFGVAAVEASACGLPVIASDAGGLPEVVRDGVTGLVVPREDSAALAAAIRTLVLDEPRRLAAGQAGREFVKSAYNWPDCVAQMERACRETVSRNGLPRGRSGQ
jgi:glycosyltransferase involved in cell wall biosynthesis